MDERKEGKKSRVMAGGQDVLCTQMATHAMQFDYTPWTMILCARLFTPDCPFLARGLAIRMLEQWRHVYP
jgi:hypothetical protein